MFVFFLIYLGLFICGLYYYDKVNDFTSIALGIFFVCLAGIIGPGISSDYTNYLEYFNNVKQSTGFETVLFYEPTFVLLCKICPSLGGVMLLYPIISVPIKFRALKQFTPFLYLSITLWFAHFFIVNELNAIRVSVAIGLLLWSFIYNVRKEWYKAVLVVALAGLFHYSAFIFLPICFFNNKKIHLVYFLIIPISFVLNAMGIGVIELLSHVDIFILQSKLEAYNLLLSQGTHDKINVYNPVIILRVAVIYILLYNWRFLQQKNVYLVLLLKSYIISIVCMLLFSSLPAFGLRIADLFGVVEIILFPFLLYLFKEKYAILSFLFLYGLLLLSLDIYYNNFIHPYTF
jgi:hypothetical protein